MAPVDPKDIRRTILSILHAGQAGHLGSAMSAVEMLIAMYASVDVGKIIRRDHDRARVVVSKGHCAAAHYAVLHHYGILSGEALETYYKGGSRLVGLCSHEVAGVEHSTGSLGHGLSVAVGMAIANRSSKVFCLLGDAEAQEGSNWEAWLLARHLNLANLVTLIDDNGIGMIDRTKNVLGIDFVRSLRGLGFSAAACDGHDVQHIHKVMDFFKHDDRPKVIVCKTVKGKGFPPWENDPLSHYRTLNDETYRQAVEALDA